jgi:hypothetical protein
MIDRFITVPKITPLALALALLATPPVIDIAAAQLAEPTPRLLAKSADPLKKTVRIRRIKTGGMVIELSLEASEPICGC